MFQKLVSHNPDIERLVKRGYAVAFDSGHLLIRDIPYLNEQRQLRIGAIVAKLVFVDEFHVRQHNHQIYFSGAVPCGLDGKLIPNLGHTPARIGLSPASEDVIVQWAFSNKPKSQPGFKDFFENIESYVGIIAGPAIEAHDTTPFTFRTVRESQTHSVFKFQDTLTSRAEIGDLTGKLKSDCIAIIGLGGTGAYLLDFLAKTPVRQIRAFDGDDFHVHNAFRSPGKLDSTELGKTKAEVYHSRYGNFRTDILIQAKYIDSSSAHEFEGVNFAFVCVDKGSARAEIFEFLMTLKIPFIDVGMGLSRKEDELRGMLRTTYYSPELAPEMKMKGLADMSDAADNLYRNNIQIAELNALNASMAIVKYKQLRNFYSMDIPYFHVLFDLSDLQITGEKDLDEL